MFVLQKTYDELLTRTHCYQEAFVELQLRWNALVEKINSKGGEEFLENAIFPQNNAVFSKEDLREILIHLHPDKHNGSKRATKIFQLVSEVYKSV